MFSVSSFSSNSPVPLFHLYYLLYHFVFLCCPSLSSLLSLLYFFSLSLGDDTKLPTRVDVSLNPNTINQSIKNWQFSRSTTFSIRLYVRLANTHISLRIRRSLIGVFAGQSMGSQGSQASPGEQQRLIWVCPGCTSTLTALGAHAI